MISRLIMNTRQFIRVGINSTSLTTTTTTTTTTSKLRIKLPNLPTSTKSLIPITTIKLRTFSNDATTVIIDHPKDLEERLIKFQTISSQPLTNESSEEAWDHYCYIVRYRQLGKGHLEPLSGLLESLLVKDADNKEVLNRCHRIIRDCHLEGLIFPSDVYQRLLESCSHHQYLAEMISLIDDIKLSGINLDTAAYNTILKTFGKAGNAKVAHRFYTEMREEAIPVDVVTLYNMVSLEVSLSRTSEAEAIFKEILPLIPTDRDHLLEKTYCLLIRSLIRTNDYKSAERWYQELLDSPNLTLTTRGYNTGIQLYRKIDSTPGRILDTYHQLKKSTHSPNLHSFIPLLSGLIEMGHPSMVLDFMEDLISFNFHHQTAIGNLILRAYVSAGQMTEALRLLGEMRTNRDPRSEPIDVITYSEIIKGFCIGDDLEQARYWYQEMLNDGVQPDKWIYNTLIHHHMRHQEVQRGIDYFNDLLKLPDGNPDASTYSSVICGLLENHQVDEAMNAYYHMKEREIIPDIANFTQLIQSLGKVGKVEIAIKLFHDMQVMGVEPNNFTYSAMLQGLATARALDAIKDLHIMIKMDTTRDPDIILWNSLMNAYNLAGDFSAAFQIWDTLWYTEYPLDACSVSIILDCCSHHDQSDHFHAVWSHLATARRFPLVPNNYASYVEGLARLREITSAIDFVTRDMKALGQIPSEKTIATLLSFLRKYEKSPERRHVLTVYLKDTFPELAPLIARLLANS